MIVSKWQTEPGNPTDIRPVGFFKSTLPPTACAFRNPKSDRSTHTRRMCLMATNQNRLSRFLACFVGDWHQSGNHPVHPVQLAPIPAQYGLLGQEICEIAPASAATPVLARLAGPVWSEGGSSEGVVAALKTVLPNSSWQTPIPSCYFPPFPDILAITFWNIRLANHKKRL